MSTTIIDMCVTYNQVKPFTNSSSNSIDGNIFKSLANLKPRFAWLTRDVNMNDVRIAVNQKLVDISLSMKSILSGVWS